VEKEFSQKSHYDSHNRRKTPCENNADKIKALVDKAVEEKLKELNNKKLIVENEEVNINTVYDKNYKYCFRKTTKNSIMENVKNLLVMNKGEVIKKIVSDLEKLNYNVSYSLLNTANFGLAQNRERVYIVCTNKNKYDISFNFNNLESMNIRKNLKDIIDFNNKEYIEEDKYILLENDKIKTQTSGLIFCGYLKGNLRTNGALPNTEHLSRVHKQPNRIYHINGVNPTLSSSEGSGRYYIYDGIGVRRLSVKECFKIMGFLTTISFTIKLM
jgi:DNA (cytosine-5)-methyltransferase 1